MAAPRIAGKNARLYVADVPLYLDAFEAEDQIELNLEDGTPFGADWREMTLIDGQISLAVNAFMDTKRPPDFTEDYVTDRAYWDTAIDGSNNIKTNPNIPIIFVPGASALRGDPAKFLNCILGSLAINSPRAGIGRLRGRFAASGQYGNGFIVAQVEQSFPTGVTLIPAANGTDIKAAGTVGVMAAICVYKKSAGATFTIKIQDSTTTGGSYGDAITFDAITAVGAQFKRDLTDAGKQFHRVSVNNGGSAETLGLIIVSTNI